MGVNGTNTNTARSYNFVQVTHLIRTLIFLCTNAERHSNMAEAGRKGQTFNPLTLISIWPSYGPDLVWIRPVGMYSCLGKIT